MKTLFSSLYHVFDMANKVHIVWCSAILFVMLILALLHHRWCDNKKKINLWRLLCLIPLLISVVHFLIYVASYPNFINMYITLYAISLIALIPIPFARRKIGYRISATLTGLLSVVCGFYFMATSPHTYNYTNMGYADSFHALVETMDETYVLKEWKEIDFDALEEKYMPLVEEAEKEQNPAKFYDAIRRFCNELYDGHVYVEGLYDKQAYPSVLRRQFYGLIMVSLDNGDVIAVRTTTDVQNYGINDGTIITKWNGKPILQAIAEDTEASGMSVKSNADKTAAMLLSTVGGDTVEVSFLDEAGKEQTVTLSATDDLQSVVEAYNTFTQAPRIETEEDVYAFLENNFSTKMLTDKCGYLMLNAEETDNHANDILGYLTGNHEEAREMFRQKLRDLKSQGMEYLVIDLRNNGGGFDEIGSALVELLTDEDWYGQGFGIRRNGEYICVSDHGIYGDGEFSDLQVVALTNYNCASAGDGISLYLSRLPNVTLAGITDPSGCGQEAGGVCALSGGQVIVGYPIGLILNENGEPNIDTKADRISRNPVEVRIPFDYDAAMAIFRDKKDYELEWAIKYLEEN